MAMEILRPQDCLADRFRTHVFPRPMRSSYGVGTYARSGRKQVINNSRLERKRYGQLETRRSKSEENLRSSGLISGQLTILKRGESLDSRIRSLEMKKKKEREAFGTMLYWCWKVRAGA